MKKKTFLKLISMVLVLALQCSLLAGCSGMEYKKKYKQAEELFAAGEYTEAAEIYAWLDIIAEYKDSAEKENMCNYAEGKKQMEAGQFGSAEFIFSMLDDYLDSEDLKVFCEAQKEYNSILERLNEKELTKAADLKLDSFDKYVLDGKFRTAYPILHLFSSAFESLEDVEKVQTCKIISNITDSDFTITSGGAVYTYSDNGLQQLIYKDGETAVDMMIGSYKEGDGKCPVCGGTGTAKFYYGDSDLEAILSGHDPYTFGACPAC